MKPILISSALGVAALSAILGRRSWPLIALVFTIPIGWWLTLDLSGEFVNRSGSGENQGAYAFLGVLGMWLLTALAAAAGAVIGAGVRWWIRRGGARRPREAWSPMEVASAVFVIGVLTFGALLTTGGSSAALTGIVVLILVSVGLIVVAVGTVAIGRRSRGDRGLE